MIHRIKAAWRFLTGKYPVNKIPSVYVHDGGPENRFVQLLAWRDTVLALDVQGKIWELRQEYPGYGGVFTTTLVQESQRGY